MDKPKLQLHVMWLASLISGTKSLSKIAKESHRDDTTIKDGIKDICLLMGIDYDSLPKGKPGRPRKIAG
jgi:hypothetical protein